MVGWWVGSLRSRPSVHPFERKRRRTGVEGAVVRAVHLLRHQEPPPLQHGRHGVPLRLGEVRLAVGELEQVGVGDAAGRERADVGVAQPAARVEGGVRGGEVDEDDEADVGGDLGVGPDADFVRDEVVPLELEARLPEDGERLFS